MMQEVFETLGRLFLRSPRRPKRETTRPRLEQLETRDCPAVLTWTNAAGDGAWNNPNNWLGGAGPNGPTGSDDVKFDGAYSTANCTFTGAGLTSQDIMANSITLTGSYTGTLHLAQPFPANVGPGGISEANGDIEQETGQPINDGGDYNWTGGNLNPNSPFLADLNLTNGKNFNLSSNQDETTGTNINLKKSPTGGAGATGTISLPGHTLTFNKDAGINIEDTCTLNLVDGTLATNRFGTITNAGTLQKTAGTADFVSALPIANSKMFQLQAGVLKITGNMGTGQYSFEQTAGTTDLWDGSYLKLTANFHQVAGNFWEEGSSAFLSAGVDSSSNIVFDGGVINLNHNNQQGTGSLSVPRGKLKIQGTTEWDCKLNCDPDNIAWDQISVSAGSLTLGGGQTKLVAQGFNIPGAGVPEMREWDILQCINAIGGDFGSTVLDFHDGTLGKWTPGKRLDDTIYFLKS